jgi:hypothetical protein
LLDGSFALYPWDVLENVVTIVEFAAAHREGHEHVCGSILTLFTRPEGSRRATFGISSAVQRGATGAGAQPERREVIAPVADVVKSVVAAARELALHVPLIPPPRPTIDERGTRDPMALAMLNRLDRLDALSPPRRSVY